MQPLDDDMKTVRQWSLLTLIPYRTILDAVKAGDLPALRFTDRGQIYVRKADIDQWTDQARERARRQEQ